MKRIRITALLAVVASTVLFISCLSYEYPEKFGFTEKETLDAHGEDVISMDLSSDGRYLVTSGMDKKVMVWDTRTKELAGTAPPHPDVVDTVAFGPETEILVTGCRDGYVRIYELPSGELRQAMLGHPEQVYSVAVSPDGTKVLSGGKDDTVRLWSTETGELLHVFQGHSGNISTVAFGPKGERGYSAALDGTLRAWKTDENYVPAMIEKISRLGLLGLSVSNDGKRVAVSGIDSVRDEAEQVWNKEYLVYIADLEDTKIANKSMRPNHRQYVWALAWSPDGETLVSGGNDRQLYFWDADDRYNKEKVVPGEGKIWSVEFSPDGKRLYVATGSGKIVIFSKSGAAALSGS